MLRLETLTGADEAHLAALLDPEEAGRAARLRFARDRSAFIAAHGLCRLALTRRRPHVAPGTWGFQAPPLGKPVPVAEGADGLAFSLSHTAGLVAVATAEVGRIGVDVEAIRPATATLETAGAFCSAEDAEALFTARDPMQGAHRFFSAWTLKESVVKATGRGLSEPLQGIRVGLDPPALVDLPPSAAGAWHVWSGRIGTNHWLSLAVADLGHGACLRAYEAITGSDGVLVLAADMLPSGAFAASTLRSSASTV